MTSPPTEPLSAAEREELRQAAEAATPETKGHWRYRRSIFDKRDRINYAYVEWGKPDAGYGTGTLTEPQDQEGTGE